MKILPINKNGQIVIPAAIRHNLGITENSLFLIEEKNKGVFLMPVREVNSKKIKVLPESKDAAKKGKKKYTWADAKKFIFSKPGGDKNLSKNIDKILYS